MIAGVEASDGIIAVSPVFSASYSGLFKSFIDVLDPKSLEGKAVLLGATGGTDRHQMVLDFAMRPLFSYLRTRTAATGVFAGPQDWGNNRRRRLAAFGPDRAGGGGVRRPAARARSRGSSRRPLESLPFEQLLAGISGGTDLDGAGELIRRPVRCAGHEMSCGFS